MISKLKTRVAVLVPLYKTSMTPAEEFSFKRTLEILADHDIYVVGPRRLSEYFSDLQLANTLRLKVKVFEDTYFSSIAGYNRLLKSRGFYQAFEDYEYVLIAQTDALIIRDRLNEWCERGFSYVGAPWFRGGDVPSQPLSFLGVGNGGLSLRKVSDCLRVLSRPRYLPNNMVLDADSSPSALKRIARAIKHQIIWAYNCEPLTPRVNEDWFWGMLVPQKYDFFVVPTPEEAARFAFEVAPRFLYELVERELPFGCHAWEKYDPHFWKIVLEEAGINLPLPSLLP